MSETDLFQKQIEKLLKLYYSNSSNYQRKIQPKKIDQIISHNPEKRHVYEDFSYKRSLVIEALKKQYELRKDEANTNNSIK
jgi:hypothetical protein